MNEKSYKQTPQFFAFIIFFIIGTFFIGNAFLVKSSFCREEDRVYTTAVIERIETYYDSEGKSNHSTYVRYTVDGVERTEKFGSYSSDMYEGKQITIYYDRNDPARIGSKGSDMIAFLIMLILGGIFVCISILFLAKSKMMQKAQLGDVNTSTDPDDHAKKEANEMRILSISFLIGGIITIVLCLMIKSFTISDEDRVYTTAVIDRIETHYDSEGETYHKVYVRYSVGEVELTQYIGNNSLGKSEGEQVKIYYDCNEPARIGLESTEKTVTLVFIIVGAIFIGASIFLWKLSQHYFKPEQDNVTASDSSGSTGSDSFM